MENCTVLSFNDTFRIAHVDLTSLITCFWEKNEISDDVDDDAAPWFVIPNSEMRLVCIENRKIYLHIDLLLSNYAHKSIKFIFLIHLDYFFRCFYFHRLQLSPQLWNTLWRIGHQEQSLFSYMQFSTLFHVFFSRTPPNPRTLGIKLRVFTIFMN